MGQPPRVFYPFGKVRYIPDWPRTLIVGRSFLLRLTFCFVYLIRDMVPSLVSIPPSRTRMDKQHHLTDTASRPRVNDRPGQVIDFAG